MKPKKLKLEVLIKKMTIKQQDVCNKIRKNFASSFDIIPGSSHNHQAWVGGYKDHLEEVMNIAYVLYESLNMRRKLDFSLSSGLFLLFLHDMDKVFRYEISSGNVVQKELYNVGFVKKITTLIRQKYNYILNKRELNALQYVHGEGKDYSSKKRVMDPLTAFVHCCDIISARIWFDKGKDNLYW